MNKWIENILVPFFRPFKAADKIGLVILDNFSVHCTSETSDGIAKAGARLLMLPANTTSVTQPLDVGVNKPFKDHIKS